jgi:hypothetical protein
MKTTHTSVRLGCWRFRTQPAEKRAIDCRARKTDEGAVKEVMSGAAEEESNGREQGGEEETQKEGESRERRDSAGD